MKFGLQIHITEKCQYNCAHCYMERNPLDMQNIVIDAIKRQIEELSLREIFIKRISLTGGDPLCHNNWSNIVSDFCDMGLKVKILGTPKTLSSENLAKIKKFGIDSFQVSLDGLAEKHQQIRGANTFQETIDSIILLYENGIQPHVMYTVNEYNKNDLIPLISYLHSLNIRIVFGFDFCVPIGNASDKNFLLSPTGRQSVVDEYCKKKEELINASTKLFLCEKTHYINAHKYKSNSSMTNLENEYTNIGGCSAGWSALCIMPNGDVMPCRRLPVVLGNILKDNLYDLIMHHPFMVRLRNKENYGKCSNCEKYYVCRGCPAIEYAANGSLGPTQCNFFSENKNHSQSASLPYSEREKIERNAINTSFNTNSFIRNKEFLKAFYMLRDTNSMNIFSQDPIHWLTNNNIKLSNQEIQYLLVSYYLD